MTQHTPQPSSESRVARRRPFIAFGLAALAVGGLGAAVTSAAWTDNAFFSAPASAATFNLQGSLNGADWSESDDANSIELVIPASDLANLLPGESRSVSLWVRNQGSVSAALTSSVAFDPSSTFIENPSVQVAGLATSLTPADGTGSSDQFELVVTTPENWSPSNQGAGGTVTVTIAATAIA